MEVKNVQVRTIKATLPGEQESLVLENTSQEGVTLFTDRANKHLATSYHTTQQWQYGKKHNSSLSISSASQGGET
jgi:hypothetical protein